MHLTKTGEQFPFYEINEFKKLMNELQSYILELLILIIDALRLKSKEMCLDFSNEVNSELQFKVHLPL